MLFMMPNQQCQSIEENSTATGDSQMTQVDSETSIIKMKPRGFVQWVQQVHKWEKCFKTYVIFLFIIIIIGHYRACFRPHTSCRRTATEHIRRHATIQLQTIWAILVTKKMITITPSPHQLTHLTTHIYTENICFCCLLTNTITNSCSVGIYLEQD